MTTTKSIAELNRIIDPIIRTYLTGTDWTWGWDNAVSRVGCCSYKNKRITFSREILPYLSEEQIRDTIYHEIAHMLVGGRAGHGPIWASMCRRLGGHPTRQLDLGAIAYQPNWKWIGTCPGGHTHRRQRISKSMKEGKHSCGTCSPVYDKRFMIQWTEA